MLRLIGLTGSPPAGSGKDTAADYLVRNHKFIKIALADEIKRIARRLWGFSTESLWGPSYLRNTPDKRYVRVPATISSAPDFVTLPGEEVQYLTPRHALQQIGTEVARSCYENTWVDIVLRNVRALEFGYTHKTNQKFFYEKSLGLVDWCERGEFEVEPQDEPSGFVIPDVRFDNEALAIRKEGGEIWCIARPIAGLKGEAGKHVSEAGVDPKLINKTIDNSGTLDDLYSWANLFL